jgi:hypothetical protein
MACTDKMSATLLDTKWDTPLPQSGYDVTTMLSNQKGVYAGTNGYVYKLDYWTGIVAKTNPLSGRGYGEVRLAAPADASLLIVGMNGHVMGLHPTSLVTLWETQLDANSGVVSVLCAYGDTRETESKVYVYAGTSGRVYRLNPKGTIMGLPYDFTSWLGSYEVRLGISPDLTTLFVGINGYLVALESISLIKVWYASLPGSGYDVTNVVGGSIDCVGVVYAGCGGRVYVYGQSQGTKLHDYDLGTGKYEVRMALDGANRHLYVGCNGYGIGLRPNDLGKVYTKSLPSSGYSVTDVVAGDEVAYFANNGIVFQVDLKGIVNAEASLQSAIETRLAVSSTGMGQLFVGADGNAYGLELEGYPTLYGPWMKQLAPKIGPMMLRRVAIPGTHDSATYGIDLLSPIGNDDFAFINWINRLPLVPIVAAAIMDNWAITQTINFSKQLASGIRYFDLRVQWAHGSLNFVHGLRAPLVTELIEQLSSFLMTSDNDKEVVLLDFNHFYTMTSETHKQLAGMLQSKFGSLLAPATMGMDVTLNQLWATTYRIIIFYHDPATVQVYPFLWSQSTIRSPWPNKQDVESLRSALKSYLPNRQPPFFVLQGILTPTTDMITRGLVPYTGAPDSVLTLAEGVNPELESWLKGWTNQGINIVICDWFNFTDDFVDVVVNLNKSTYSFEELADGTIDHALLAQRVAKAYRKCAHRPSREVEALLWTMEGRGEEAVKPAVVSKVGKVVNASPPLLTLVTAG